MTAPIMINFAAGVSGRWLIDRIQTVVGDDLAPADRLAVNAGTAAPPQETAPVSWTLRGFTSNTRYANRAEADTLAARQHGLARPEATRAALIPIRKTPAWWALAQDERRAIFEEQSHHTAIGLDYLPAIARRLHHSRDLAEPFDFLTWFEYAPAHEADFDHMLGRLRATPEWRYVDREVDIRLTRD